MSQPRAYGPDEKDPFGHPLVNVDQLDDIFKNAERKKTDFLIGLEYEMFGQINGGLLPLPYEGATSITSLFHHLVAHSKNSNDPFLPLYEGENIVALSCARAIIALEPGGQIEIALKPHHDLLTVTNSFKNVVEDIHHAATQLNIDLFALGIHPAASQSEMAVVKKSRYAIMRNYMGHLSGLGLDMMTRSCAIQINLDFKNEADMVEKMRLGAALSPIFSLLCASTAFIDKIPSTHAIERGHVWRKTDPDRTGIPFIIFERDFGYRSWIEMVLDVPMYFIRREQNYHDVAGASFRDFIAHGLKGFHATVRDFIDHMTTVFTEVRLKPILELRSADSLPIPFANALTALSAALFYDDKAKNRAQEIFSDVTHAELATFRNSVIDRGRSAEFRGQKVFELAKKLLGYAQEALENTGKAEAKNLLKPLCLLVEKDVTCAEWIKDRFKELNHDNLPTLIRTFSPLKNPLL